MSLLFLFSCWFSKAFSYAGDADLGQLLMVGFSEAKVTPELLTHLKKIKPGAIILFRRNIQSPEQLKNLVQTLRRELEPQLSAPILFAIDQEGGSVFRIPTQPRVPSPAAIGKSDDPKIVERYGYALGKLLRKNGISMNLAPVLDVDLKSNSTFIGSRSFGDQPQVVAQMGYLFAKGLAAAGVVPTGKHFPGIGSIVKDPHLQTPMSEMEWEVDWNRELLPFREFSRLTPSALMLSHVIYPKLDVQRLPASVSPYIIKGILRDTFKYDGLVVTDDLLMKGITDRFNPSQAALASLNSGADLIMLSWSRKEQLEVLENLRKNLANQELKAEDLKEKIERIRHIKNLIGLHKMGQETESNNNWLSPDIRKLNYELLEKNLAKNSDSYRRINYQKSLYVFNLSETWVDLLRERFPDKEVKKINDLHEYQKLTMKDSARTLLFCGVARKKTLESISNLPKSAKGRLILVVTGDLNVSQPEHYYSVFAPLWPFEGMPSAVLKYL